MLSLLRFVRDIFRRAFAFIRSLIRRFPRLFTVLAAWLVLLSPASHLSHKEKIKARGYLIWELTCVLFRRINAPNWSMTWFRTRLTWPVET